MPSTSFEPALIARERVELWVYRVCGYLLINVMDDPAWLALMFC